MPDSKPAGEHRPRASANDPIEPGVRVGHAHLRTADIARIRDFYVGVLGFDVIAVARDVPGWGTTGDLRSTPPAAITTIGFNTRKSRDGAPQPGGVAGLHHIALAYPSRRSSADACHR